MRLLHFSSISGSEVDEEEGSDIPCSHTNTHSANIEGYAGVWCLDCGDKIENDC